MTEPSAQVSVLHRQAIQLNRAGYGESAIACMRRAVILSPDDMKIVCDHFTLSRRFRPDQPHNLWAARILVLNPLHLAALRMLGEQLLTRQSWRRAVVTWSRVVVLYPGGAHEYRRLAEAGLRVEELGRNLRLLRWAASVAPRDANLRFMHAQLLFNARRFEEAGRYLSGLLEEGIEDPNLSFWIGRVLHARGQREEAESQLIKAAGRNRDFARRARMVLSTVRDEHFI